jgi:hypothetical protein
MPDPIIPTNETFGQAVARIAATPAIHTPAVKAIQIDLSPTGILTRMLDLATAAHQRGDISAQNLQEISGAVATLKAALGKIDETTLAKGVALAPLPAFTFR